MLSAHLYSIVDLRTTEKKHIACREFLINVTQQKKRLIEGLDSLYFQLTFDDEFPSRVIYNLALIKSRNIRVLTGMNSVLG